MGSISTVHKLSSKAGTRTRGRWVRSANANSVLYGTLNLKIAFGCELTSVSATGNGKRYPEMMDRKMEPGMANVWRKRYVTNTPPST